jgi:hypothetical protein
MATRRKSAVPAIDPAQANNEQVLRDRAQRIEAAKKPIPDLGLNIPEPAPANAAEFLADEWDRKTFGDAAETTRKLVYGPDPLFDSCPGMKASIEKIGLHDYADATAGAILKNGEMAVADAILQTGLAKAISKFGVEKVAQAFRERILKIPCREIEYEVDRDMDYEIVGSKVLDEAVERYGRPGMAYKFLADRVMGVLGMRGYQIVKDEKGEPVRIGNTLFMGEIPLRIAEGRRRKNAELAREAIEAEVEKYQDEAERLAAQTRRAGVGPLLRDELMTANASEFESSVGQTRPAGFTYEQELTTND